jgi:anti-sigma factor RsiW
MRCLTDVDVQAVLDHEASEEHVAHVAACERCRARVDERRASLEALSSMLDAEGQPSPGLEAKLRHAVSGGSDVRGSTVLRASRPSPWRARLAVACAAGVVIALVAFGLMPRFGAPTTLSASEILQRSLQTISSARGVEMLEYEVAMDGMTPGPVVIRQVIDRDNPNRYKVASYMADGTIATAISQDPIAQRRSQLFHVDGTNYIVRVAGIHKPVLSLPQMAQALVETSIGIMQAKSDQQLTVEDGPNGRRYVIEIPPVTPATPATTLDIFGGRAVISGRDFRIQEFEATGSLLRQPFSVSVRLRTHQILGPSADNPGFEIEPEPGDVVLEGQAADDPITELMTTVLRELGKARGN